MPTTSDPAWFERLDDHCRRLTRPVALLGVIGMLVVSGATMLDVILRWTVDSSVVALNEIVSMVFAVTITACLPYGVASRVNLKLDLLEGRIKGRLGTWVSAIGMVLVLVFLCILTWRLALEARTMADTNRLTTILRWPTAPFLFAVTALLAVATLVQAVVTVAEIKRALAYVSPAADAEASAVAWIFVLAVYGITAVIFAYGVVDLADLARFAASYPGTTLTIICLLMWLLLLALVPLQAVMSLAGLFGAALFTGPLPALSAYGSEVAGFLTNSQVAVLPLFLMMGSFAAVSGIAEDIYALAHAGLSRLPGGLAMSTIGGCAGFGAITGSTVATAAMVGRIALPEMKARGYSPALSTGCIAAGGTLGNLVPPGSGPLVLFALLTEASIGQLFIASAIPALLAIAAYMLTALLYVYWVPGSAPPSRKAHPGELRAACKRCGPAAALFLLVLGGLYFGYFTDTEAAAVGAFAAFLIALLRGKLLPSRFFNAMGETTETTALVYPLIFGALIFAFFTSVSGLTESTTKFMTSLNWPPLAVVGALLVAFVVFGTFMDSYAIMIVTVPIVTGLITGIGYDIIWWGVINLFVVEIGGISPPFGLTMYVLKNMADVPIAVVFRGVAPFCLAAVVVLVILVIFPSITLWLPSTMFK